SVTIWCHRFGVNLGTAPLWPAVRGSNRVRPTRIQKANPNVAEKEIVMSQNALPCPLCHAPMTRDPGRVDLSWAGDRPNTADTDFQGIFVELYRCSRCGSQAVRPVELVFSSPRLTMAGWPGFSWTPNRNMLRRPSHNPSATRGVVVEPDTQCPRQRFFVEARKRGDGDAMRIAE